MEPPFKPPRFSGLVGASTFFFFFPDIYLLLFPFPCSKPFFVFLSQHPPTKGREIVFCRTLSNHEGSIPFSFLPPEAIFFSPPFSPLEHEENFGEVEEELQIGRESPNPIESAR